MFNISLLFRRNSENISCLLNVVRLSAICAKAFSLMLTQPSRSCLTQFFFYFSLSIVMLPQFSCQTKQRFSRQLELIGKFITERVVCLFVHVNFNLFLVISKRHLTSHETAIWCCAFLLSIPWRVFCNRSTLTVELSRCQPFIKTSCKD